MKRPCPACASLDSEPPVTLARKQALGGGPMQLARCRACGCQFQPLVPTAEALAAHYEYMGQIEANVQTTPLLRRRLERLIARFGPPPPDGRLLEIGCGGGLVVRVAEALGWRVWGTEISASCVELLRPAMGERLFAGALPDAPFAAQSFDAALLIEVIEHLSNPADYLRALQRLLKPGARLLLSTPNAHGASARLIGHRWRAFADEHLNAFDARSIETLLEASGFAVERLETSNFDAAPLVAGVRRALRRLRTRAPQAMTASGPAPTPAPALAPTNGMRAAARARLTDAAIEAFNATLNATGLGDSLKVLARRR
jgi:SAM-dependent methyltransferase